MPSYLVFIYPTLLLAIIVSAGLLLLETRADQAFGAKLFLFVAPLQLLTLHFVNQAVPFVPRETDAPYYYEFSQRQFHDLKGYVDIDATSATLRNFEGVPYTHVLTIVNQFVGDSLFGRKLLNWTFIWPTVFAWYWIAKTVLSRRGAQITAICIAAMPTIWYFFLILYRDMLTLSFQSVFFVAALRMWDARSTRRVQNVAVIVLTTACLLFLRPVLAYANAILVLWTLILSRKEKGGARSMLKIVATIAAIGIALWLFGSVFGDYATEALRKRASIGAIVLQIAYSHTTATPAVGGGWLQRAILMVPLYICSELAVGSGSIRLTDPDNLGGLLNLPWSALFVPFVCVALSIPVLRSSLHHTRWRSLIRIGDDGASPTNNASEGAYRRLCLGAVWGYVALWYLVSLLAWDWTRWRLPAVPALTLLAVQEWQKLSPQARVVVLTVWWGAILVYRLALGSALNVH